MPNTRGIAFNLPEPVVDGNVIRVFSRLLGWTKVDIKSPHTLKRCWQLASKLVDLVDPGLFCGASHRFSLYVISYFHHTSGIFCVLSVFGLLAFIAGQSLYVLCLGDL